MDKYIVKLSQDERENLLSFISKGKTAAQKLTHARILLEIDENFSSLKTDKEMAAMLHVSTKTIQRVRQTCVELGIEAALERKAHIRHKPHKIQGEEEAKLIALCCSNPPKGYARWTLKLLAGKLVVMEIMLFLDSLILPSNIAV